MGAVVNALSKAPCEVLMCFAARAVLRFFKRRVVAVTSCGGLLLLPLAPPPQIWDLESKVVVDELRPEFPEVSAKAIVPYCTCLCWSNNGSILYSG